MQLHSIIYDHSNIVRSISSDRNLVVSGGEDNTVYINDVSNPDSITQLATLTDHTAIVRAVELNGDVLATAGEDNTIYVYDMSDPSSPTLKGTLTDPTNNVSSLSIYDDALFVGSTDNNVYVYDVANLDSISLINTETQSAGVLSLSADSVTQTDDSQAEILAAGLVGGNVELYDISTKTGFVGLETKSDHTADVNSVSIGEGSLATGSTDNDIKLYDLTNVASLIPNRYTIDDYTDSVFDVEINKNLLVTGGRDNYVRIYNILDLGNPIVLDEDNVHADWVYAVSITKDVLSTGGRDNTVRVNDVSGYANLLGLTASLKASFPSKEFPNLKIDRNRKIFNTGDIGHSTSYIQVEFNEDRDVLFMGSHGRVNHFKMDGSDIIEDSLGLTYFHDDGWTRSMMEYDDTLYVGGESGDVTIIDVSDIENTSLINTITGVHTGDVNAVFIRDNILALGSNDNVITLHDVSDPSNPQILYTITDFNNNIAGIYIRDNLLVAGSYDYTVKLYDISDPSNPILISDTIEYTQVLYEIKIEGDRLVTACADDVVRLYDISDPSNPVLLDDYNVKYEMTGNDLRAIDLQNDLLVLGTTRGELLVFSIEGDTIDLLAYQSDTPEYCHSITVYDNLIAKSNYNSGTSVFDIYDIINGSDLSEINYYLNDNLIKTVTSDFIKVHELNFTETEAEYLTNGRNFLDVELVDQSGVSDKTTLAIIVEVYEKPYPGNTILIDDVEYKVTDLVSNRDDFVVTLDKPLETNLIADESEIELTNLRFKPEVFVTDDPDYTPSQDEYLPMEYKSTQYEEEDVFGNQEKAVDEFQLQGTDVTGRYAHFKITGERTNYNDGVNVEGGERFGGMVLEGSADCVGRVDGIKIVNNVMIAHTREDSVKLWDISDISDPRLLSDISIDTQYHYRIGYSLIENKPVFSVADQNGVDSKYNLNLYDISDPSNPQLLSTISDHTDYIFTSDIRGTVLATGSWDNTVKLYDISDPSNPSIMTTLTDSPSRVYSVFIKDNILVVGSTDYTVRLYDISDPSNPVLLSTVTDHNNQVYTAIISDNIMASGDINDIFTIHDISDPSNPVLLSTVTDHTGDVEAISIEDNILVTGSTDYTSKIYDISDPSNPQLLSNIDEGLIINAVYLEDSILAVGKSDGVVNLYSGLRSEFVINRPWISRPRSIFRFKSDLSS